MKNKNKEKCDLNAIGFPRRCCVVCAVFFSTITRPRKPKQQKVAGEKKAKDS